MTEYEEEYEDFDLRDDLDELEEELDEIDEINSTINTLQAAYGIELNSTQIQDLGELIDGGYDPHESLQHLGLDRDHAFDGQFGANVERIEAERGRELSQPEVDKLWEAAAQREDPTHVAENAVYDTSTKQGRIGLMSDRFDETNQPQQEQPESVAKPDPGASKQDRLDYMTARMSGAEADTQTGDE